MNFLSSMAVCKFTEMYLKNANKRKKILNLYFIC